MAIAISPVMLDFMFGDHLSKTWHTHWFMLFLDAEQATNQAIYSLVYYPVYESLGLIDLTFLSSLLCDQR